MSAGEHLVEFDGSKLTSGIYIYELKYRNKIKSSNMILIK